MKISYQMCFFVLSGALVLISAPAKAQDSVNSQPAPDQEDAESGKASTDSTPKENAQSEDEVKNEPEIPKDEGEQAKQDATENVEVKEVIKAEETSLKPADAPEPAPATKKEAKREKKCILRVETDPPGARVLVSDSAGYSSKELGNSPLESELAPGVYWVNIIHEGYEETIAKAAISPGDSTVVNIQLVPVDRARQIKRHIGHALIWPGLSLAVIGIVMIEMEPQGDAGTAGFATAGVGVALGIAGGILLGLSHRDKVVYQQPQIAAAPLPDGRGAVFSFGKSF
ncbi:MAG: PEGA domain-containing protein [Proteobacteria bacterium]|nr:PEGA domain-containing protein [Pseudomonadota bacterium]